MSTPQLIKQIADKLGISTRAISSAGLKDARAIARQTLSVQGVSPSAVEALHLQNARVLWVTRHRNKLRTGHLRGNRFSIRIRDWNPTPRTRGRDRGCVVFAGVPNAMVRNDWQPRRQPHHRYYLLHGTRRAGIQNIRTFPRMKQSSISASNRALQPVGCTHTCGILDTVIAGDVARKEDTGGIFTVEDADVERPRATAFQISPTGPIYGYKLMQAREDAGALEAQVLADAGITLDDFRAVKAEGVRRPLRYNPGDVSCEMETPGCLSVSFFAPKGSFATALLRELMKVEAAG